MSKGSRKGTRNRKDEVHYKTTFRPEDKHWLKVNIKSKESKMHKIMEQSINEIKMELIKEIFLLLPEEQKAGKENFQVEFKAGEHAFKLVYKNLNTEPGAEFHIQKGVKLEDVETVDILFFYKQALIDELKKSGKDDIVAKRILEEVRARIKERAELILYKLDAETEVE